MKKIILSSVAILLVIGLAAGVYWWLSRPQIIKFSDDSKLILLGVDYGKRHTVPGGKLPKAPPRPGAAVRRTSSFQTPTDTLVVWVRAKYDYTPTQPIQRNGVVYANQNQNPSFQFYVYDPAGAACASASSRNMTGQQRGDDVLALQFDSFPRREGKLFVRAQENYSGGNEMADDNFLVANPAAGKSFAKWTPEPMPDRQTDGDLAMTLTKLVSGATTPYRRNQDNPDDAMNKGVQVAYRIERNGKPVMNWQPVSVETTDATGNQIFTGYGPNGNQAQWNGEEATFTYQYGLWPDEPAWKVRMQMTQNSDFSSDEEWTAQNIPVVLGSQQSFNGLAGVRSVAVVARGAPPGRGAAPGAVTTIPPGRPTPCAEADLNGHHIKVFPAVQFTNMPANMPANYVQPQQTGLMIQIQPAVVYYVARPMNGVNGTQTADDGMRLTLAKVTDDQGGEFQTYTSGSSTTGTIGAADSSSTFRYTLRDTGGITNITATIAIHKNRSFEFTVKPEKAATDQP